jgi:hypothetical protein
MLRATSKHAYRFRFDSLAKHRMEAGSRHHVGFRTEDIAHPFLDIDQFDEAETWVVGIEEQIDVAVRPGLQSGDRAEQMQPSYPRPMKIGFVGAKGRDHLISIHLPSPKPDNHDTVFIAPLQFPCGVRPACATRMLGTLGDWVRRACTNGLTEILVVLVRRVQAGG